MRMKVYVLCGFVGLMISMGTHAETVTLDLSQGSTPGRGASSRDTAGDYLTHFKDGKYDTFTVDGVTFSATYTGGEQARGATKDSLGVYSESSANNSIELGESVELTVSYHENVQSVSLVSIVFTKMYRNDRLKVTLGTAVFLLKTKDMKQVSETVYVWSPEETVVLSSGDAIKIELDPDSPGAKVGVGVKSRSGLKV